MALYLTKDFVDDLREAPDLRFVRQVLNHTVEPNGAFRPNRDDHRYDGIEDAWIRYVSTGSTAYRVIFIRKGADVFLYRAGTHAVENNLPLPSSLDGAISLNGAPTSSARPINQPMDDCCLLKTTEARLLGRHIEAMYHVKHTEICIVSPFVEFSLLDSRHGFGRFLDRAIEENTIVSIVTAYHHDEQLLPSFKKLEERGINVFFVPRLHTKLYFFDVDLTSRNSWQKQIASQAIIGSSNLTGAGLGLNDCAVNEELNCRLPSVMIEETKTYIARLVRGADDYKKFAFRKRTKRP